MAVFQIILLLCLLLLLLDIGFAANIKTDTITRNIVMTDPDTISSSGNIFELGFFSPDSSNTTHNRYLGIYYAFSQSTVVWIANRGRPVPDSSGRVTITGDGNNIVVTNGKGEIFWSSNVKRLNNNNNTSAHAQLLDNGNLVFKEKSSGDDDNVLWESFLHPSDVFLPTQKAIDNTKTGYKVVLSSWKTRSDPGVGSFSSGIQALDIYMPQVLIWNESKPYWRSGPWNGQILIGVREGYLTVYIDGYKLVNDPPGTFSYSAPKPKGNSLFTKTNLNSTGSLYTSWWDPQNHSWDVTWSVPENECDVYGTCGAFGSCNANSSPVCSCLRGFEPESLEQWGKGIWDGGCVRRKPILGCQPNNNNNKKDGFFRLPFMKVPDFAEQGPQSRLVEECRILCLENCSCIAYVHDTNIGCIFWTKHLIDVQQFSGVGQDLYVRVASAELDESNDKKVVIIIPVVAGLVAISICVFIAWWTIETQKGRGKLRVERKLYEAEIDDRDHEGNLLEELPLFTFNTLAKATDKFCDDNMLGKGGYGPVYKGKLADGKEIAVKRLSVASGQGMQEFMNEVSVISKLQHRNLVKLLGYSVEKEEKILVYEYMPNKSLDTHLSDPLQLSFKILDWNKRFNIIQGIGRGLLYLHRDSILKIIHRDLKPSNILLDDDWNPKISDFGMARIFGGNQDQGNTSHLVGTYGYMAPEYAMEGRFSEKSDVYSFGVVMLEILSGKVNTGYYNDEWSLSLLGWAWKLWNEDKGSVLMDQTVLKPEFKEEMMRCIHIALLCVQEFPEDRPAISTVLAMLTEEIIDLPLPHQPVFSEKWNSSKVTSSQARVSINDVTVTIIQGR